VKRQTGSHIILRRDEPLRRSSYPTTRCWTEVRWEQSSGRRGWLWMNLWICWRG